MSAKIFEVSLDGINYAVLPGNDASVDLEGEKLDIAFNSKYLIDALKVIEEEEIVLEFTTNISPGILKPAIDHNYTYLILPVRLSSN